MNSTLAYFAQQGPMSEPGAYISLFENLPTSIPELVKLVQGVTIHVFWAERYSLKVPPEMFPILKRCAQSMSLTHACK